MTDTSKRNNDVIAVACVLSAQMSPEDKEHCIVSIRNVLDQREREKDEAVREALEEYRQFIYNILDGVDIANEKMGLPSGTLAIRHAIASRYIGTTPQEAPQEGLQDSNK